MRGALTRFIFRLYALGIIPAYAGSTYPLYISSVRIGDHPRVCGERLNRLEVLQKKVGSSPRMRGALRCNG